MVKGSFAPAFPLKHQQKDLRLVLELAEQLGQDLPVAAASNNSYLKVRLDFKRQAVTQLFVTETLASKGVF